MCNVESANLVVDARELRDVRGVLRADGGQLVEQDARLAAHARGARALGPVRLLEVGRPAHVLEWADAHVAVQDHHLLLLQAAHSAREAR